MKREKEIELAMKEAISESIVAAGWGMTPQATDLLECAFTKGAEWADKTMLDRACEWLKKNIDLYAYEFSNTHYPEIKLTECFEEAFRQAMEGSVL